MPKSAPSIVMSANYTVTALKRWSCKDAPLPPVDRVKHIHIYDFDNTLFSSPLPNKQLWSTSTFGQLQAQEFLHNGGWWHNPRILSAVGDGVEVEEPRAWEGCWNEKIVDLVRLSVADEDTVTVLLTGRKEDCFSDLLNRMLNSKGLDVDMVALKPNSSPSGELFSSTMTFKQALLKDVVLTYTQAEELRLYEDRPKHVKGFRDFFMDLNRSLMPSDSIRPPITAEVIQVSEQEISMDPTTEIAEVQAMINAHNAAILNGTAPPSSVPYKIKRSVFYTGYLIAQPDIERLKTLIKLPAGCPEHELRYLANNILITPRPAPPSILDKVGGIGAKMTWKVTGVAIQEQRVWAARVAPSVASSKIYTENYTPCVVLATRRQAKPIEASRIQNWQPVPDTQAFEFETTVGEKVLLRIEEEYANEDVYEAKFPNSKNARKHPREEDFPPLGSTRQPNKPQFRRQNANNSPQNPGQQSAWASTNHRGGGNAGRGGGGPGGRGGGGYRGRGGNGQGRGRGRGGRGGYRSLDDNIGQQGYGSSGMQY
ncbi:Hypothetical protein R9X50_00722500 [Acrodontium crateriforme]|uniref:Swiss Army Knife RNA repair protein HAD domain-containing protein n=1 Tax=Acrodontium crateriforme TaxID=150365 RepID=A0AAQ3RC28_9PEZI|nr:Hypothetical protein R9X50_00722500 [Acrodontium crateriforme]